MWGCCSEPVDAHAGGEFGREHLNHHAPAELDFFGDEHAAHPAAAELSLDPVGGAQRGLEAHLEIAHEFLR